jgi:outer membrane protein TolC
MSDAVRFVLPARAAVDAFAKADHLIARRFQAGIVSGTETSRSGAQPAEARAQLADVTASRALIEHAIGGRRRASA